MSETEIHEHEDAVEMVVFRIGDQEYCMDIMKVREIRGWSPATRIPHAPSYVSGIMNLRGAVIPIVDLAVRLGLGETKPDDRNVIIVGQVGSQLVGFLVDAVSDILTIVSEKVQPTPDVASDTAKQFVSGVIAIEDRMIRVFETGRALPQVEVEAA